ncbi:UPF0481 protein At3g47200-like [Andrographis paniculata]|uniref:UPF0481 protein At3g47200-like n=1 Tax=Andrographis paniculata TaxID=175694 RepID=UPI0021E72704|nr:UPF0481 protein At3g47200-like [Andrographis paniculata]
MTMNNQEWSIKIDEELKTLVDKSAESARWSRRSIYRIPATVTELNKRAYKPQIVSFGPYHHGVDYLKPMEEHKRRALLHFLKRAGKTIGSCVDALTPVVQDLKDAYDQLDARWQNDTVAFLQMMIVDGCFILEILRATTPPDQPHPQDRTPAEEPAGGEDYASNDPIFSKHGKLYIVPYLRRDMLMLENQIPMLVFEKLVSIQNDPSLKRGNELTRRLLKFLSQPISPKQFLHFGKCLHILDVYRKSLLLEEPRTRGTHSKGAKPGDVHHGGDEIIRSATELNEAGITIVKSKTRSLRDISFHKGVLKLPLVVVDDALESLYLNMIAFERFHVGAGNEVTSYAFFMDNIIDNARDVSLLHECGIVQNALGSDKAVANLFNALSKDVTLDPESRLDDVHKQVSAYCQKRWNRWRANLMHTYFTNPWAILSVIAAALLFALTIVQTVYSVMPYVVPK